uniref:Uncharacterized protein n=1 Tax=mine drainage metagenome TaxID=410659 RepID=E6QKQ1_9ZZZZ
MSRSDFDFLRECSHLELRKGYRSWTGCVQNSVHWPWRAGNTRCLRVIFRCENAEKLPIYIPEAVLKTAGTVRASYNSESGALSSGAIYGRAPWRTGRAVARFRNE